MTSPNNKVLIYRIGSLGDTILALPCFHKIRDAFPDADITLLTNRPVMAKAAPLESILGSGHFFNRVINYPIGTRNLWILIILIKQIRSLKIDTVVNLTPSRSSLAFKRDKWFFKLAGISRLIGFPQLKEDFNVFVDPVTGKSEWETERLVRRISSLGYIPLDSDYYWDLRLTNDELNAANKALSEVAPDKPIIAISVGTKNQSNDWGVDNWIGLIKRLRTDFSQWSLLIIGAKEEKAFTDILLDAWGENGINLCGMTSPRVSAAILKKAFIFIGHDSGPLHLAGAVGTPCVGIFSARNLPGQWFPRGRFNKILYHRPECAGCGLEVCIEQKKKCILSITIDEVHHAVLEIV